MPRGKKRSGAGKKSTPVRTREAGVNKMIREDAQRKKESKAVKGGGGGSAFRGGDRRGG